MLFSTKWFPLSFNGSCTEQQRRKKCQLIVTWVSSTKSIPHTTCSLKHLCSGLLILAWNLVGKKAIIQYESTSNQSDRVLAAALSRCLHWWPASLTINGFANSWSTCWLWLRISHWATVFDSLQFKCVCICWSLCLWFHTLVITVSLLFPFLCRSLLGVFRTNTRAIYTQTPHRHGNHALFTRKRHWFEACVLLFFFFSFFPNKNIVIRRHLDLFSWAWLSFWSGQCFTLTKCLR